MDILHLVDRLEELVNEARQLPMHKIIMDEDRLIDLIDQMRVSIPEEVKQAQRIMAERDRLLAQAQEQAERTVRMAQQKGNELIDEQEIAKHAESRAEEIMEQARENASMVQVEADEYVIDQLERMETEVMRVLQQVQNGLLKLKSERGERGGNNRVAQ